MTIRFRYVFKGQLLNGIWKIAMIFDNAMFNIFAQNMIALKEIDTFVRT